jgi:hypothetical protein
MRKTVDLSETQKDPWPEGSPTVSMETGLANHRKRYDFDIHAYNKLLKSQGIDDASDLAVTIKEAPEPEHPRQMGHYSGPKRNNAVERPTINVNAGVLESPGFKWEDSIINGTLLHETKHFIQDTNDQLHTFAEKERRRRFLQTAFGLGSFVLASVGLHFGAKFSTPTEELALLTTTTPFHFVIGAQAGNRLDYPTRPEEREARRFEKEAPINNIVQTS